MFKITWTSNKVSQEEVNSRLKELENRSKENAGRWNVWYIPENVQSYLDKFNNAPPKLCVGNQHL